MQTTLYSYSDAMSSLADWFGSATTDATSLRRIKLAVEAAYREIANIRRWSYFMGNGRLTLNAQYNTGTIAYTNSTRAVTLTGGTWPSYAAFCTLSIAGVQYQVASRDSDSQVTLSVNNNPGADVAAGASYVLWRDTYPLPVNFVELGTIRDSNRNIVLEYVEPNDFVAFRLYNTAVAQPRWFTITSDPHYTGTMALRLYPPPDQAYTYDYMYHRRPRPFTMPSYTTGTVTSSSTTVTGVGTTWTSSMIGTVIRTSPNSTTVPTGTTGANPYVYQRIVTGWTNATTLTIDQAFDSDISSAVKHEISDPIDVEAGAMYTALLRRCEYELGVLQRRDDLQSLMSAYMVALNSAMEADNRNFDRKPEGTRFWRRVPNYYAITNATN